MKVTATTDSTYRRPEVLEWDTEFWGLGMGRSFGPEDLSSWAAENTVGMVCLLIDADSPSEAQEAEERGFRLMDIRVTLERLTRPTFGNARSHVEEDVKGLVRIARESHRITRFYADSRLDRKRCDDLYETWVLQSCAGWAEKVLVTGEKGAPTGYCSVHLHPDSASIGLIAVDEGQRLGGRGKDLVEAAIDFSHSNQKQKIWVVTQGRNVKAQRLFQSCGFRTVKTELWYHRWYT